MRIFILILLMLVNLPCSNAQFSSATAPDDPRIEKIINSQWTFNYFPDASADQGYEAPGLDDYRWPAVSIPHTWSTYETTGDIHPFIKNTSEKEHPYWWNGWGWYRKRFTVNPSSSDRKIFIEFEGVQKYCKVWINGKYLGDHKGGYGSFDFDITDHLNQGKENVLAVAVNNAQNDKFRTPPMLTDRFNVYGGICRNVKIIIKDRLHIPMQGSSVHEGGTFVTTPRVSERSGTVRVMTWVKNDYPKARTCILATSIYDAGGKLIRTKKSKYTISPGQLYKFDQTLKPVTNPRLWSPDDPYLYTVVSEVTEGKRITDRYTSPLGFRWFRWDNEEDCLYLNGTKVSVNGINRTEEYPWLGAALPEWISATDLKNICDNPDHNLIKNAYFPGDKKVYDLADKYGLLVIEEVPNVGNQDFSEEVQEQQLKEMIRRDRNHPSVLFWSLGNETSNPADPEYAIAEDTTRILTGRKIVNKTTGSVIMHSYDNMQIVDLKRTSAFIKDPDAKDPEQSSTGEPARIVLKGSHEKIPADRASVVLITADVVDTQGNHVDGSGNTVRWSVNGPASLVGPDLYEAATVVSEKGETPWYTDMPVSNIIRSTGKPGKIRIFVSASGLASGVLEIEAEETETDNSVITEAVLRDEGRRPVTRLQFGVDRIEDIPQEIEQTYDDINFDPADIKDYARMIREYIVRNNTAVDSTTVEFRELVDLFSAQLSKSKGQLVAWDYNFSTANFNNCRLISGYIDATKLPPLFKETLKQYYADAIIRQGNKKNAGEEMNWMNWIPSGGIVIVSQEKGGRNWPRGTITTIRTELGDLITAVHPVFSKYSREAKERALTFVSKMNPYVTAITKKEIIDGNEVTSVTYTVERGKPILIPEIKFISQ
ncbi:MAG: beta galactosidase jelly roll domain-containing protein [Bacteroidales bacterium]|nr:beta galactosidase jelly roll domain-containing protein [Bacteroidales bacterium]